MGVAVDPSLVLESPPALSLRAGGGSFDSLLGSAPVRTTVLVAEGLPPIPAKLLERIRRWEFIDLAQLVFDASKDDPGIRQQPPSEGILIVQSMEQMQRRRKAVNDIFTWSKAFAIYAAALSGAELTTKEECAGLWAHLHLVTQLSRDLGGGLWLQYDSEYREWAAAKGIRTWGELNLSIYGHCLSNRLAYSNPAPPPSRSENKQRQLKHPSVCYPWNFDGRCEREELGQCKFAHTCYYCGSSHRARDCSEKRKRPGR